MKTIAIIVAAGTGSRFSSDTPKQFLELAGRPLIEHTIGRFDAAPCVDEIILVLAADRIGQVFNCRKPLTTVEGGVTRARSVLNGLNAASDAEIVAVHDGARPFVSVDEIERTVARAAETGAACLVAPVIDTIKTIVGGEIAGTLDRDKLRRALTPQVFRADVLRKAFEGIELDDSITDECYLVEKLGHPIAIVEGGARNIKITHPADLMVAEAMIKTEIQA